MANKDVQILLRNYLAEIGARGGKVGGKSKSEAKLSAAVRTLEKARKKRWPKRKKPKQL